MSDNLSAKAPVDRQQSLIQSLDAPSDNPMAEAYKLAKVMAISGLFADLKAGTPEQMAAQAFVKILAGREYGLGPFASMTGIKIVEGRPELSPQTMACLIKKSRRYDVRVVALDNTHCHLKFFGRSDPDFSGAQGIWNELGESSFSLEDAKLAGLNQKPVWQKYPRNLCYARAMSNGFKWFCAELTGGPVYSPGEIGGNDEPSEVVQTPNGPVDTSTGELVTEPNNTTAILVRSIAADDSEDGLGIDEPLVLATEPKPRPAVESWECWDCQQPIVDSVDKKGKLHSAKEIADFTRTSDKYARQLCPSCKVNADAALAEVAKAKLAANATAAKGGER